MLNGNMMIIGSAVNNETQATDDTTSDGKQVIWVVGDSLTVKRNPVGSAYGPTPTAGTVYQWNTSSSNLYEIGATDILQSGSGANWGSIWPQAGIEFNNATDKKPVFVTSGVGGTNFGPRTGETDNWSDSSTLYATKKSDLDNCLNYLGLSKPKYIIVMCGTNDAEGNATLANVEIYINNFFAKVQNDYPGVEILILQICKREVGLNTARLIATRNYLKNVAINNTNCYIVFSILQFYSAGGLMDSDDIHLNQTGNNEVGKMLGKWLRNSSYTKWARTLISCHLTEPSSAYKTRIQNFVTTLGSTMFELDYCYPMKSAGDDNDLYLDFALINAADNPRAATYTANLGITSNGSTTSWRLAASTSRQVKATQNDGFAGLKIKTNRSAAGTTTRAALAGSSTTSGIQIGQLNTSLVYYRYNDLTNTTYSSQTKLPDNTFVVVGRNGTTKMMYQNGVQVHSATLASVGLFDNPIEVGASNFNNSIGGFINLDVEYVVGGKLTTVDQSTIYSAMEALVTP